MVINEQIFIPDNELEWAFSRSGGPGGQNVNKVASRAQLRWHTQASTALEPAVMERLRMQQRNRITNDGDLLIASQQFRDQERNRADCVRSLCAMIEQATRQPRTRRPTRPSTGARLERLNEKRRRSDVKNRRRPPGED